MKLRLLLRTRMPQLGSSPRPIHRGQAARGQPHPMRKSLIISDYVTDDEDSMSDGSSDNAEPDDGVPESFHTPESFDTQAEEFGE